MARSTLTLNTLILIGGLNHVSHTGGRVAVALTAISLHASPFVLGTITALYGLLPALLAVAAGRLNDRIGARIPMMFGSALFLLGTLTPAVHHSLPALYLAATLIGMGNMSFQVSAQNVVGLIGDPEDRTRNFSLLAIGVSVGAIVGPLTAGYGIDYAGYSPTFVLLALFPVASLALFAGVPLALPDPKRRVSRARARAADLFADRGLVAIFIVTGLHVMSWELFTFLMPIHGTNIGLSASTIGVIMGAFSVATFFIRSLLPIVAAHFATWHLIKGTIALAGIVFLITPMIVQVPILILLAFVLGCAMGVAQPLAMTLVHNAAPSGRAGEAVGIRSAVVMGGQTAMPLVFGALGTSLGLTPVFWLTALVLWTGIVVVKTGRN